MSAPPKEAIRVVGDPNAKVSRIATGAGMATPAVNVPDIDVVIGGAPFREVVRLVYEQLAAIEMVDDSSD